MRPSRLDGSSSFPRSPAYSRYAEVYDRIGQRVFGEQIATATLRFLAETGERPESILDLACGTGAASLTFAAAGLSVTGIDLSTAMLDQARRHGTALGLDVAWLQGDLRSFAITRPVDLVTCFYDGYNYLTEPMELAASFDRVWNALCPRGLFVFDVNTRAKFGSAWNDICLIAADRDDLFGIYQSWFEPETGLSPLVLTFFVRREDGTWERFDEEHIERAYPLDEIRSLLGDAGFAVEKIFDYVDRCDRFGGPGSERSHRVVFVARRQATVGESPA